MSILSDLTLDDLRYLVAYADAKGISAAAEKLGVKQPTVSKRMDLWRACRPPLVTRSGNRDELTDRGHHVVASARAILHQLDQLSAYLKDHEDTPNSFLMGAGSVASQWYLAPTIANLLPEKTDWQFRTRIMRGANRLRGVAAGEIDIAIVSHDQPQIDLIVSGRDVSVERIADHPLCVVAHQRAEAARELSKVLKGQEVPLSMLSHWNLVGLDSQSGVRRYVERQLTGAGLKLRFVAETGGWAGAKEFARCGVGVALLPLAYLTSEDTEDLVFRRLSTEANVQHSLVRRRNDQRPIVQEVTETIKEVASEFQEKVRRRWHGII
jgi:DNA-binding transcriptional LysR family regulator